MTRYIDADAIKLSPDLPYKGSVKRVLLQAPTADVAPVVHGKWVLVSNGHGVCSNCNRADGIDPLATHCRYCGAKMDLED